MFSQGAESIVSAFSKAYESAVSNFDAAVALAEIGRSALAASIAIAALEEVGKMMLLDDVLFARRDSQRDQRIKGGRRARHVRLDALELYPQFLQRLTSDDPRHDEPGYKRMMAIASMRYDTMRQKLAELVGPGFVFRRLDSVKQQGLYSHQAGGTVKVNRDAVDLEVATAILELVRCITDTLPLVLGPSFEHYRNLFHDLHEKDREAYPGTSLEDAAEIFEGLFGMSERP
jgi:AbiV family abortive infection protein